MGPRSLIICIFFLCLTISSLAQSIDPYCHVEVVSGSPASFVFSSMSDYDAGKTLIYTSTVRAYYFKEPLSWQLCVKSAAPYFDGPGDLGVEVISMQVENLYFNKTEIPQLGANHSWTPAGPVRPREGEQPLCTGNISRDFSFGDNQVLDFVIRLTCRSTASAALGDAPQGYYVSQAIFYMNTSYK